MFSFTPISFIVTLNGLSLCIFTSLLYMPDLYIASTWTGVYIAINLLAPWLGLGALWIHSTQRLTWTRAILSMVLLGTFAAITASPVHLNPDPSSQHPALVRGLINTCAYMFYANICFFPMCMVRIQRNIFMTHAQDRPLDQRLYGVAFLSGCLILVETFIGFACYDTYVFDHKDIFEIEGLLFLGLCAPFSYLLYIGDTYTYRLNQWGLCLSPLQTTPLQNMLVFGALGLYGFSLIHLVLVMSSTTYETISTGIKVCEILNGGCSIAGVITSACIIFPIVASSFRTFAPYVDHAQHVQETGTHCVPQGSEPPLDVLARALPRSVGLAYATPQALDLHAQQHEVAQHYHGSARECLARKDVEAGLRDLASHPRVATTWIEPDATGAMALALMTDDLRIDDPYTGSIHHLGRLCVRIPIHGATLHIQPLFDMWHPYLHHHHLDISSIQRQISELYATGDFGGLVWVLTNYLETPDLDRPGLSIQRPDHIA